MKSHSRNGELLHQVSEGWRGFDSGGKQVKKCWAKYVRLWTLDIHRHAVPRFRHHGGGNEGGKRYLDLRKIDGGI